MKKYHGHFRAGNNFEGLRFKYCWCSVTIQVIKSRRTIKIDRQFSGLYVLTKCDHQKYV